MEKRLEFGLSIAIELKVLSMTFNILGKDSIMRQHLMPLGAEFTLIRNAHLKNSKFIAGADDYGLMYALLDVTDRISWSDPSNPFSQVRDARENPAVTNLRQIPWRSGLPRRYNRGVGCLGFPLYLKGFAKCTLLSSPFRPRPLNVGDYPREVRVRVRCP